ncbi:adhesive plaque matrix protein isoform X1 [Culex quinquefasciatus]|uniref:adhesive plaque matrix protein isoform X1 n=1 Tax=Culex quinquefasciatus TaxID=7176 RepID=UPI0018E32DCF|nr:adhesive plaque matrix protein isoform X1 [Culex quinquefasciatus]XP_038117644.1 adhesive plaque matrix protein isoform X1 [Culex quinquefasciatus]
MKKIRRWLLVFAVIITLMVRVDGLKATSLIFGRGPATSSTSTTSSPTAATSTTAASTTSTTTVSADDASEEEEPPIKTFTSRNRKSDDQGAEAVTKAPLTGIPQVDYVWDPNLPRELNGFNLSHYPFLDSVPTEEDIGFTCDPKLHDGFYASIKFGCQLYHHCIHGVRYDFLCANYTAFDQKTFICHFASEVDCKNSPKYWFRNEPLYKATTTTTQKPAPTLPTTAAPTTAATRARPFRPTVRRRRPQVDDYYDDEYEDEYYEERPRRRKNRPRNRRPIYEDEYEDEDRFERRPADRYRDRERDRDVDDEDYEDRRPYRPSKNRNRNRTPEDDRRYGYEERKRRPVEEERRRPAPDDDRRPVEEERRSSQGDRRKRPTVKPVDDRRPLNEDRRSFSGDERRRPAAGSRRPYTDDRRYDYDEEEDDYSPRRPEKKSRPQSDVVTVKPSGSTIYDKPRAAPRINRPVPLNEKNKYSYVNPEPPKKKPSTTAAPVQESEPEYYDEYEDEPKKPAPVVVDKRKVSEPASSRGSVTYDDRRHSASSDVVYYDDVIVPKDSLPQKPVPGNVKKPDGVERVNNRDNSELANRYNEKIRSTQRVSKPDYDDEEPPVERPKSRQPAPPKTSANIYNNFKNKKQPQQPAPVENRKVVAPQTPRDYEVINKPAEVPRPIMRSTKRPFLPSRGGNPYAARGLQPVGVAKQNQRPATNDSERPAPFRIDVDASPNPPSSTSRPPPQNGNAAQDNRVKTLDQLYDEEFDVTLNDALNPTLKPLTRSAPANNFFRNRYVHQSSDSDFVPFEPSFAPSEFRRAAVRPPPHRQQPTVYVSQVRGHPLQPQRYEYEYEY